MPLPGLRAAPPSPQLGPGLPPRRGCTDGGRPSCSSRPLCTTGAAARYQPARPARAPAACRPSAGAALPPCLRLLPSPYPLGPMSQRQAQEQPAPPRGGRGHGEQRGWAPARPAALLRRDRGCRRSRGRPSGKAGRNIHSQNSVTMGQEVPTEAVYQALCQVKVTLVLWGNDRHLQGDRLKVKRSGATWPGMCECPQGYQHTP